MLYNACLQAIWKTALNPQIGIIHVANRRGYTLNLDFADLFKPIIVDRVIFKLINCKQIKADLHFERVENNGCYLTRAGKKIFLKAFEKKMNSQIVVKGKSYTYRQLIMHEVYEFYHYVDQGKVYKPYKYY